MNTKLTLGEKLKDLRTAKKLKLDDVSESTGISTSTLQRLEANEDEYLRYRISERFNLLMKSLFENHKTDKLPLEQFDMLTDMKEQVQTYLDVRKDETANKAKAIVLCKQLGLNASKLTDEEWRVLMKTLENSAPVRRVKKRK